MIDALLEEAEELLPVPDTGSLRDDLITYLTSLTAYLNTPQGNDFDRALAAAGDDPAASHARKQYWDTRYARSDEIGARASNRGELPDTTDPRHIVEMLIAPLHFKIVLTRKPLDPDLLRISQLRSFTLSSLTKRRDWTLTDRHERGTGNEVAQLIRR
ncbi:TetR-like C-terminal domain-containing protein [Rhodococcus sp. NPDC127530]|uniref:TetR-like C-terminal domain-containing protein n=1 Tax=unclassified Rhodococcus (in: high G+C Gram-positive bacteria) TaxID=192944 RepID=UPI0036370FAF